MARAVPAVPNQDVAVVDTAGKPSRDWFTFFDLLAKLLRERLATTGTATFAAATTVAVTFAQALTDANYNVTIDSPANRTHWVTSKTTTGFTINASASNSDTVGWTVVRR